MKGVTPIPAPINTTLSLAIIDSIGLGKGPSKIKFSFLGTGTLWLRRRFFDFLRLDFSECTLRLKIFWYSSPVQSPWTEIAKLKTVFFCSMTKSVIVNGCHSSVEMFSHCSKINCPGWMEMLSLILKVRKIALFVGRCIETVLIRVKNLLKYLKSRSKK